MQTSSGTKGIIISVGLTSLANYLYSISCEDLPYFWEPFHNSSAQPILRMRSPTPMRASPSPMQIIDDFVRAKVAAGGELRVK